MGLQERRPVANAMADEVKNCTLAAGMKLLDEFFKGEADMRKPRVRDPAELAGRMAEAREGFHRWMER